MAAGDVLIQQINFRPDGIIEIAYSEDNDMSDRVAIIKTLMFDAALFEADVRELQDSLTDLIYRAIEKLRNPPMTRHSGLVSRT